MEFEVSHRSPALSSGSRNGLGPTTVLGPYFACAGQGQTARPPGTPHRHAARAGFASPPSAATMGGDEEGTHGLLFKSRAEKHSGMVFIDNSYVVGAI